MRYPTVENLFDEMLNNFNSDFFTPSHKLLPSFRRENALIRTDLYLGRFLEIAEGIQGCDLKPDMITAELLGGISA